MLVLMVRIGKMHMRVCQRIMPMPVAVFGAGRYRGVMRMLVVHVVNMFMFVLHELMHVGVFVALGQVQHNTKCHACTGYKQRERNRLSHY